MKLPEGFTFVRWETTHRCPLGDSGVTPCCERTPFELPATDRLTLVPAAVNCGRSIVAVFDAARVGVDTEEKPR